MSSAKGKERAKDDGQTPDTVSSPKATAILVIGMAGSGKTTFIQRLNAHLHGNKTAPYLMNLDPAVRKLPYEANIDVRDTVDYRQVMEQYSLGPNGAIMTALNLFTTKFDQVLGFIEKRASTVDHIIIDTPGQIEIFTWSASGSIITDAVASALPTCIAYIVDTPRSAAPATFMSNMLYACSILYKTKLPLIVVFNKTDVRNHKFIVDWMQDFTVFQDALTAQREAGGDESDRYMNSLSSSMSLVLDEFYKNLGSVGVSAMTGEGIDEFFQAVKQARLEFETEYKPELERVQRQKTEEREQQKQKSLDRLIHDLKLEKGAKVRSQQPIEEDEDFQRPADEEGEVIDGGDLAYKADLPSRRADTIADEFGNRWPAPH